LIILAAIVDDTEGLLHGLLVDEAEGVHDAGGRSADRYLFDDAAEEVLRNDAPDEGGVLIDGGVVVLKRRGEVVAAAGNDEAVGEYGEGCPAEKRAENCAPVVDSARQVGIVKRRYVFLPPGPADARGGEARGRGWARTPERERERAFDDGEGSVMKPEGAHELVR
jgi:hypothetical protein